MMKPRHLFFSSLLAACCLFLSGCALQSSQPPATLYDLGPSSSMPSDRLLPDDMPTLVVFRVNASDWLNNTKMYYRLAHVNDQQTRFYTLSRWNESPPKQFRDRLKSRIVSAGGEIGGARAPRAGQLRLIVNIEDFSQYFTDDSHSEGRIALRVSVLGKDGLVAQKSFLHAVAASTPDAPGGTKALSVATDEVIAEILLWIVENYKKG
ncbi:PqiC family protein [Oxalobacter vibrioformis]|uniref:PqiC family protein n=1 Tax=Oxalobacter vibrioformis TaxID=933080 RepID=A0A9E9LY13_9BURK|nr:ABC-type transport auxiliary lipoprotein family protein [Oxalobacter vibrioformis]WAW08978.1 PqiC family protein [Oxalobacter vibrioformis]